MGMVATMMTDPERIHEDEDNARATTQAECDAIAAEARKNPGRPSILRDFSPPPPLEPTDNLIEERLSEEIDYARRVLEAVGDRLIADPLILHRHESTLQSFDIIGQLLGHLAKVTGSKDKLEAINRIGMQELRARLNRPAAPIAVTGTIGSLQRNCTNPFR